MCATILMLPSCTSQSQQDKWDLYKSHFLNQDGSIVDAVNGSIRHSEGQGVGMLFAAAYNDRESFDRIWVWTKKHLQVRENDALLAWRWQPKAPHVTDYNNASDGDILVAWALLRAYEKWSDETYLKASQTLLHDIQRLLVVYHQGRMLLLPGQQGFMKPEGDMVNLSYWIFPAFVAFQDIEPNDLVWTGLIQSGLKLTSEAGFGVWKLPPDWLMVGETLYPAQAFPKRFGLDAVRIPLYLQWAGYSEHQTVLSVRHFWQQFTGLGAWPEWASLEDSHVHMADQVPGLQAVASYLMPTKELVRPIDWEKAEYYQMTLVLMSQLAKKESVQ
ncbi:MAG: glycosyl hydrolase family 8 [Mariprofundaceae bacterium]